MKSMSINAGVPSMLFACVAIAAASCTPNETLQYHRLKASEHDRDIFPTGHGGAENPDADCNVCHGGLDSFKEFNCLDCHAHEKEATDAIHGNLAAYAYESSACYECHKAGSGFGGDHDQFFVTSEGDHSGYGCSDCHLDLSDFTQAVCIQCHDQDAHACTKMNQTHKGLTDYNCADRNCLSCHPRGVGFDIDHDQFFVTSRGHHSRYGCSDCHFDAGNYGVFTCIQCHDENAHACSRMNDKHDEVRNYRCEDQRCLDCHRSGREEEGEEDDD